MSIEFWKRLMLALVAVGVVAAVTPALWLEEPQGVHTEPLAEQHAALAERIQKAPAPAMKGPGLAGVMGSAHVKVMYPFPQELLLPIPQLANGQIPIALFVRSDPPEALSELRLWDRSDGNVVLRVRLVGKPREVKLEWTAVVLLFNADPVAAEGTDAYRNATGCVQSQASEIKNLASELWPKSGKAAEFAAAVQKHIAATNRRDQPRSLDALGIFKSGENSICTANANLAAALLRANGIPCRSVAVVPPNGMKLEMHRVVEFADAGRWQNFDPSSLTRDIPAKPWQNIVMARTSIADEETAMTPRMGAMVGCPYGQELELLTKGVTLYGQDFFWTTAKPLAEFAPTDDSIRTARAAWTAFLKSGSLRTSQRDAAAANTAEEFATKIKSP